MGCEEQLYARYDFRFWTATPLTLRRNSVTVSAAVAARRLGRSPAMKLEWTDDPKSDSEGDLPSRPKYTGNQRLADHSAILRLRREAVLPPAIWRTGCADCAQPLPDPQQRASS